MILYHGTIESRGKKIVKDGKIDCHAERLNSESYEYIVEKCMKVSEGSIKPKTLASTPGYTYCTNSLMYAIYYGNKNAILNNENEFYIFKFDISEDKLEPDQDEVRMVLLKDPDQYPTAADTLKACKSARYGDDITEFKYCILPATNYFENVNRELIYAIVCEHNYNPEKSNEDKRKYVEDLLSKLHDIVSWK